MKQYSLDDLLSNISDSVVIYLASSLPVGNHPSQQLLGKRFFDLWTKRTFKGPYIECLPEYSQTKSLSDLLRGAPPSGAQRLINDRAQYRWRDIETRFPQFLNARGRLWEVGTYEEQTEKERTSVQHLCNRRLYVEARVSELERAAGPQKARP